jgi:osmotically inducible lipoprotein OsmB
MTFLRLGVTIAFLVMAIIYTVALTGCTLTQEELSGGATGGLTGALVAGPVGAAVGAGAGAVTAPMIAGY